MGLLSYIKSNGNEQPIDIKNWKSFDLIKLFDVELAKGDIQANKTDDGDIPLVSAGMANNGICKYIEPTDIENMTVKTEKGRSELFFADIITVDMFGKVFYQDKPFFAVSHGRVNMLKPKFAITRNIALYICAILETQFDGKYSFAEMCSQSALEKEIIMLPVDKDNKPDWNYIEKYINDIYVYVSNDIVKKVMSWTKAESGIDLTKWKNFELQELFDFQKGKRLTKTDMEVGETNYLGAISCNNGIRQKINATAIFQPNCLTVNYNGSVGETFYQTEPFWAGDDVNVLYPKGWALTKYNALFLAPLIQNQGYQFSYGSKWSLEKMKATIIYLPIDDKQQPNWQYMEKYIKDIYKQSLVLIS
jgi:hypothetical protein